MVLHPLLPGRVKTLHPGVHGGILARRDLQEHLDAVQQHSISLIDVVRCRGLQFMHCRSPTAWASRQSKACLVAAKLI